MFIDNKFNIGQIVYLKTDREQEQYIITSIRVFSKENVCYFLATGSCEYVASELELNSEKNENFNLGINGNDKD